MQTCQFWKCDLCEKYKHKLDFADVGSVGALLDSQMGFGMTIRAG